MFCGVALLAMILAVSPFWAQFWPNMIATIVGAVLGIPLALSVDRFRERGARRNEEAVLFRAAQNAVEANCRLFSQLTPILAKDGEEVPTFATDVGLLETVVPRLAGISSDTHLLALLNDFLYQLHHLDRKLDRLFVTRTDDPDLRPQLSGSALLLVRALEKSAQELQPMLTTRIEGLERPRLWKPVRKLLRKG